MTFPHPSSAKTPSHKLLLSSVFGPFAIDDLYGRKENRMELFHNQVTREQGIFSYRFNHHSFGLYLMAENVGVPTTVLDFPSLDEFRCELRKGYDHVGISFIVPNIEKARKMAEIVRAESPGTKILLGGHGVSIHDIERLVPHDHICRGDGVAFLRRLFGEAVDRPVRHPLLHSSFNRKLMGVRLPQSSGVLMPGVGCPNKCRFCCTSHFFGDYLPFLSTGREIFDVCRQYEEQLGVVDFGVLDENFLKSRERALELLECIEREKKLYTFGIFSSAETLRSLGDLDALVRLGVHFVWIGVESKHEAYKKNEGTDFHEVVRELRRRGVSVMASAILFLEHHDQESIWQDVDYAISIEPDYLQFMQLGPMPGTALHDAYLREGKMLEDVPYSEQHGQGQIWFRHPEFTRADSRAFLKAAFQRDYLNSGASLLRCIDTMLHGYKYALGHADPRVRRRAESFVLTRQMRLFLPAARLFAENRATADLAKRLESEYRALFGRRSLKESAITAAVTSSAAAEWARIRFVSDVRQPRRNLIRYRWQETGDRTAGYMTPALAPEA
jgi:radical SAM superfamily enzyme YgiQ (UPF0313 family)